MGVTHRLGPWWRRVLGAQLSEERSDPSGDAGRCRQHKGPRLGGGGWSVPERLEGAGPGPGRGGVETGGGARPGRGDPALGPPISTCRGSVAPGRCDKAGGGGGRVALPGGSASGIPRAATRDRGRGPRLGAGPGRGVRPCHARLPPGARAAKMAAAAVTASRAGPGGLVAAPGPH